MALRDLDYDLYNWSVRVLPVGDAYHAVAYASGVVHYRCKGADPHEVRGRAIEYVERTHEK